MVPRYRSIWYYRRNETSQDQLIREMPQTIMTLEEVLRHPALRKMPINIEIKDHRGKQQNKQVTEYVLDVIGRTNSAARVLISSFNHDYLVIAKELRSVSIDCRPPASLTSEKSCRISEIPGSRRLSSFRRYHRRFPYQKTPCSWTGGQCLYGQFHQTTARTFCHGGYCSDY